ncbi:MAG: MBL fold metallo-hydrolase [Phycisphaerales bacterium]|nr:MAG: MBL fold metallo-hydrolase [Phycisphaerales bacterium]
MKVQFLGAVRQVTGSRCLLEAGGLRVLIDCGYYQERDYLARNWEPMPVDPASIDYLLLTHAHLDHCGSTPKFVGEGFAGTILTTAATRDLAEIIMFDSAHIQEEDAAYKRKRHEREGRKGPYPVRALYTADDVRQTLPLFKTARYDQPTPLNDDVSVTYHDAGHILGSAMLELNVRSNGEARTVVFSGDIGQWDKPIVRDPSVFERADYIVMESTYGGRNHDETRAVEDQLCDVINETVAAGGNVVIPTFAVERAQELMYHISRLTEDRRIPQLIAFLDSPMAADVTEVFRQHQDCMDEEALAILRSGNRLMQFPGCNFTRTTGESKAINRIKGSCIIMATSGMCTAGRIKHHLANNVGRPESSLVFIGFQAHGTLGREFVDGKRRVRIHGQHHEVKARVVQIHGFSAHADQSGLLKWLGALKEAPRQVFLMHGEEEAALALADKIRERWSWDAVVPDYQDEHELD